MSVSVFVTAADISLDLTFCFSFRGFFFFSESFSHHSESSFFCDVDSSLYSEFVWYHRWTPVFPILTFPSFDVASDISIALAFAPWMPRVSKMFAAGRFVSAAWGHRATSVPLPFRNHSSFHLHHHPSLHSPLQLVGQGQSTGFILTGTQP